MGYVDSIMGSSVDSCPAGLGQIQIRYTTAAHSLTARDLRATGKEISERSHT